MTFTPQDNFPDASTLIDLLERRASHEPDRRVYSFLAEGEHEAGALSFGQLAGRARAIAAWLMGMGLGGRRVVLLFPTGLDFISAYLGCAYAGTISIPTPQPNPLRLARTLPRLEAIVADARPAAILTDRQGLSLAEKLAERLPECGAGLRWLALEDCPMDGGSQWRRPEVAPGDAAHLQYTSGSTSAPKGTIIRHSNLIANSRLIRAGMRYTRDSRSLVWIPHYHDDGLVHGLLQAIYSSYECVLMAPDAFVARPVRWLRAITRLRITHSGGPNFAYELCLRKISDEQRAEIDLSSWQLSYNAAEPVRMDTVRRFYERFKDRGLRWTSLAPSYGLAEGTLIVSSGLRDDGPRWYTVDAATLERTGSLREVPEDAPGARIIPSCGRPIGETQAAIVDPVTLERLPPNQVGEILLKNESIAGGYLDRPEETARAFGAYIAGTGEGPFLRTGDLGFLRDGDLYLTGRIKDLIIIRGENRYPQDIEWTVERAHPAIRPGGVMAFAIEAEGEERLALAAEVQNPSALSASGGELSREVFAAIRQAISEKHDLRPQAIALLHPGTVPKTSSGKFQRGACRAAFLDGTLEVLERWTASASGPATEVERGAPSRAGKGAKQIQAWLVRYLTTELGIAAQDIDVEQPFSQVGLDSVSAVGLMADLEAWLGTRLPPTTLWSYPSILSLSRYLGGEPRSEAVPDGQRKAAPDEPIAIVGMGCRFPGGVRSPKDFWHLLESGTDAIGEVPPDRFDVEACFAPEPGTPGKTYTRHGGFIDGVRDFDPEFFGISHREAESLDPQQRILLEVAWEALENAGQSPSALSGSRTAVFVGLSSHDYSNLNLGAGSFGAIELYSLTGSLASTAAGRLSYVLGLQGPSVALDAACASSLVAVHLACQSLRAGEAQVALAGGVNLILSPENTIGLSQLRLLAPDGRCKAFDAAADGYGRSEGCGVVVLKRLSDAQAAGDSILAVIRGSAVNHDGRSSSLTAPNGRAQAQVIQAALESARIAPREVRYVEAQGTGTPLGDSIEVQALGEVLGRGRDASAPLLIGSVKTQVGHLEAASGMASLMKAVLAMQHGAIPANLHLRNPSAQIRWSELGVEVARALTPLPRGRPSIFGVSAFGFNGTNAHLLLEAPQPPPGLGASVSPSPERLLLTLSARSEAALAALAGRYACWIEAHPEADLADVCFTAGTGRAHFAHRAALTLSSRSEAIERLEALAAGRAAPGLWSGRVPSLLRLAAAFPALGGEKPAGRGGSLRRLSAEEPAFRAVLELLVEKLKGRLGRPLEALLERLERGGPGEEARTALYLGQVALAELWRGWGVLPDVLMGEGDGAYAAATSAGLLSLEEGLDRSATAAPVLAEGEGRSGREFIQGLKPLSEVGADVLLELTEHPESLTDTLARLYVAGVTPDFAAVARPWARRRLVLPTYPFQRRRYWSNARAGVGDSPAVEDTGASEEREPSQPARPGLKGLGGSGLLERLAQTSPVEAEALLTEHIEAELCRVLALPAVPDRRRGFFELGMDSLTANELRSRLEAELGEACAIGATTLFDHPTVEALSGYLATQLGLAMPEQRTRPPRRARRAREAEPIAIVGIGCRFPGAPDPESFWRLLRDGREAIREVPRERWDIDALYDPDPDAPGKMFTRHGGFLDRVDLFDANFFGISPREAAGLDPQQRLVLEVSWEALENAGIAPEKLFGSRTGVFMGICASDYLQLMTERGHAAIDAYRATGTTLSSVAGRLSYVLGLEGPSVAVDTACSSSLVALAEACESLLNGGCELALAGGVNLLLTPDASINFTKARMLSPSGRCRTFDAGADGYVRAEGSGVVVLKRASDARRDGDRVLAQIRGWAVNQNGRASGLTAPSGPAQVRVIREALGMAGVKPNEVAYVEAHGTGTPLGDPIEVKAIAEALGGEREADRPIRVGSVKTNIGHLESAAGVAGLIKTVLALQHGELPPHLHFTRPNPHIPWGSIPIEIPIQPTPWPGTRRIAGVSSFGFNGTNSHVVLEAAPQAPRARSEAPSQEAAPTRSTQMLALSARGEAALQEVATRYASWLDAHPEAELADFCSSANVGRSHFEHRVALVVSSREEARAGLLAVGRGEAGDSSRGQARPAKVAFLFTGQGSQYAGMACGLYETEPVFRQVIDRCAKLCSGELEQPLTEVLFGQASPIHQTAYAQPALFALEVALASLWRSLGVTPAAVLGHSVGEYAAACIAGVMSLEDGLRLVARRGRLMQALPAGGAMAAVLAGPEVIQEVIAQAPELEIAAYNGASTALSGPSVALDAALARLAGKGIKARRLETSHAFHSAALEPVLGDFEAFAASVAYQPAKLPLISNVRGEPIREVDAAYWRRHARQPVEFARGIQALMGLGANVLIELGPLPVLLGMVEGCLAPEQPRPTLIPTLRRDGADSQSLLRALAELYTRGVTPDFAAMSRGAPRRRLSLPTYPFQRQRYWLERTPASQAPSGEAHHPLLGERVESASGEVIYRASVGGRAQPYLVDHRVAGTVVVPGASYAVMALSLGVPGRASDLSFTEALPLDEGEARAVQLVLSPPEQNGRRPFSLFSAERGAGGADSPKRAPRNSSGSGWTLHARGFWEPREKSPVAAVVDVDALRSRLTPLCVEELHQSFESNGLHYGPTFRGLQALWAGGGEALAELARPEGLGSGDGLVLHPALLDACFQAVRGATGALPELYVPLQIEAIALDAPAPERFFCLVRLHEASSAGSELLRADLRLLRTDGSPFGEIHGLVCRRTESALLLRGARRDVADWLYELEWREQPHEALAQPAHFLADTAALTEAVEGGSARLALEAGLVAEEAQSLGRALEELSGAYVREAFERLGGTPANNSEDALARLGIERRHRKLIGRMLEIVRSSSGRADPAALLAAALERFPSGKVELTLLGRCGARLADVLRGKAEPLAALFPEDGALSAEDLYRKSPVSRFLNGAVRVAVGRAIEALPAGRTLRVLEIGAGTGATTEHVLPALPADRTEYVYTDISPVFFAKVEERFAGHPFMTYRTLDIEREPRQQGFARERFDLVIAANVLHATRDLERTLSHARELLAPGGLLLVVEGTRRVAWLDLTFGLLDGWWRFDDAVRADHALLDVHQWGRVLRSMGFERPEALCPRGLALHQEVIVARGPAELASAGPPGTWLLVAGDEGGLGGQLAAFLEARGQRCIVARPEEVSSQLLQETLATRLDPPLRGVVHLANATPLSGEEPSAEALQAELERVTKGVLGLVQGLVRHSPSLPSGFWIVTRGAQAVEGDAAVHLAAAPLWGLGKVVALEHPELGCRRLDLDPLGGPGEPGLIAEELLGAGAEDQIVLRGGLRRVARLARVKPAERLAPPSGSYRLGIAEKGTLEALRLEPLAPEAPRPGEVEVRVKAAGLNFRDLLDALGAVQIGEVPLGGECAGEVVAVGEGVRGLKVGERVMGLAIGAFGDRVRTPATLLARMPAALSFAEAATIPIVFLTVELALAVQARVKPGQRILIHAAAGGVGLAAIQLARSLGAEVFATASESKWSYLRSLGVTNLWSSRTLDFAQGIREATGGRGVDLVLNSLTGEFLERSLELLAPGGAFVEIGKRGTWTREQMAAKRPDVDYQIVLLDEMTPREPERVGAMLASIVARFERGELRPLRHLDYPLTEARAAFRFMQQGRHIGKIVLRPVPPMGRELRADARYLITGGFGGLGVEVARWMVSRGVRHLVLMGRRPPESGVAAQIDALRAAGCEVQAAVGDVSQEQDVRCVLESIRAEGRPLAGVIHAAGVLDDGALINQSWRRFQTVFAPKVLGAWHLHRLTAGLELELFVLFSSAASLFGSAGQANHSAANMFLDMLAHHRRMQGLSAISIDWGVWSQIGEAAERGAEKRAAARGIGVIAPGQGIEALARILETWPTHVGVMPIDWEVYGRSFGERPAPPMLSALLGTAGQRGSRRTRSDAEQGPRDQAEPTPGPTSGDARGRERSLADTVREEVARVLRLELAEVSPTRGFFEMGMDSLMAVEIRNRLQRKFGPLSPTALFDHPTVTALARHLTESLPGAQAEQAATPGPTARKARRANEAEPIAIIGLGCRLPGAPDPDAYWRLLQGGVDAVREVPPDRWLVEDWYDPDPETPNKTYSRWGGFLDQIDSFDPQFFGIAPREAPSIDPQHRLLLEVSWEALEHGGIPREKLAGSRTGVFVGIATADYLHMLLSRAELNDAYLGTGSAHSIAANRISYTFGLEGPSVAVDTACSSSLVALHQARLALLSGDCDMALAGGVNALLLPQPTITFSKARMLSPDGRCKTFDASANGFVRSEGCGVVVLKRLSDARRDTDRILAVIRGSAVNQDGASSGLTVPNGPAQQRVILDALSAAGIEPGAVSYVEAHGTGTSLGDPIEVRALAASLGKGRERTRPLRIGSVKTNIGHLEAAAGIAGVLKVVLSLHHGELPPHLHFQQPSPHIPWDEFPIEVTRERVPWPAGKSPRIAGVSSFGFGGTNAHVVIEEAPVAREEPPALTEAVQSGRGSGRGAFTAGGASLQAEVPSERERQVLVLSAHSDSALREAAGRLARWLGEHPAASLGDVCFTAGAGRSHFEHRAAFVAGSNEEACAWLSALGSGTPAESGLLGEVRSKPRVAFLFTGQGSQYAGMSRQLYEVEPVFREVLDRLAVRARGRLDRPLLDVLFREGAPLDETQYTQPALFALEAGLVALWRSFGIVPDVVLGHSVGEYAAACAAGLMGVEEGFDLILERGRLMQSLPAGGAMAAVSVPSERATAAIAAFPELSIAAYNGAHSVISGPETSLTAALAAFGEGVRVQRLATSRAFHSALMDPILEPLEAAARRIRFQHGQVPLISNLTGEVAVQPPDAASWRRHAREPVQFEKSIQTLASMGCEILVEIGPSPVLLGMAREAWPSDKPAPALVPSLRRRVGETRQMAEVLATLYVRGATPDFASLHRAYPRQRLSLPTYAFQRRRYWLEGSLGGAAGTRESVGVPAYEIRWRAAPRASVEFTGKGTWLILGDRAGVGARLARALEARDQACRLVLAEELGAQGPESFERLMAETGSEAAPLRAVVHLGGLEIPSLETPGALEVAERVALVPALHLTRALSGRPQGGASLWLVTRAAQAAREGDEVAPAQALLWGLGRVLGLEHSELWGGLIDLPPCEDSVEALLESLVARDGEDQVALRGGERLVARLEPTDLRLRPAPLSLSAEGSYLISGGLGALGRHLARRLAERGAKHLILVNRRPLPERSLWSDPASLAPEDRPRVAAVTWLEQRGVRVLCVMADIAAPSALGPLREALATFPPLRGIIHAAGVANYVPVSELTREELARTLAPKVAGLMHLQELVRGHALDFFVGVGSIAAVWGGRGQAHYAAANAFLDAFAHHRRALGLPALSVDYGPWSGGGMASAELRDRLKRTGVGPLSPRQALDALEALLAADAAQAVVADVDWSRFKPIFEARRKRPLLESVELRGSRARGAVPAEDGPAAPQEPGRAPGSFVQELRDAPIGARRAMLEAYVRSALSGVLDIEPTAIRLEDGFFQMGMDSLMAVEFKTRLERDLGCSLATGAVFAHPTCGQLVHHLASLTGLELSVPGDSGREAAAPEAIAGFAAQIEQLSEGEVLSLLEGQMAEVLGSGDANE